VKSRSRVLQIASSSLLAVTVAVSWARADSEKALYLDPNQAVETRVTDLISRLTLEEKAILLNHRGPDIERFGIKSDKWNQCLHGVWWDRPTTMFPVSIAMAATWDPELVHEVATTISDEARAIYNGWHQDPNFPGEKKGLIYRAPVINISRNPYWGRINECYGEDPFLTGRIGVAFVKGLQGDDPKYLELVSTLKHYAVNNVEKDRQKLSATVSERMLYEYWLPHFRDCIVEGQAQSIMASYNAINGVPNNINKPLLTGILKEQWGFRGFVVSDLGGVNTMVKGHAGGKMTFEDAVAQSLIAGCDFSDKEFMDYIPVAVRQGLLPESRLNDALFRVLRARFRLGEFDPPAMVPYSRISPSVICSPEHRRLALKTAHKSIVLLSNNDHFLPLDKSKLKSIAVIGPHANLFTAGGYSGRVKDPVTPLQGIRNRAAQGTEILFAQGAEISPPRRAPRTPFDKEEELRKAAEVAKTADVAIVYVGTTLNVEAEGRDRESLSLPGNQEELVEAVVAANPHTAIVLLNAGPLTIPWIREHAPAILEAWWAGEEGGNAIADVLFGDVNPGGKLPYTFYASESQVPPQDEYDISKGFTYMYLNGPPLFAFGHGLSYADFAYSNLQVSPKQVAPDGKVTVTVDVANTGQRAGDEVVQLYVRDVECSVKRPAKELRGFQRISLQPGRKKTVTLELPAQKLALYDVKTHGFLVEPGEFEIMVGSSSEDIRLRGELEVVASSAAGTPQMLELSGDLSAHDPAIIRQGDTFYVFCTSAGRGSGIIPIKQSKDLRHWTRSGSVFSALPEWAPKEIPGTRGAWAPDISYYNGKYHLYYSVSTFGKNNSAIGLATNATLDPNSPDYKWVDQGLVVRSTAGQDDWNAIDGNLVIEDERNVWLCWGSFWGGIMMRRIDPQTGKLSTTDTTLHNLARRPRTGPAETPPQSGAIEAPFIIRHDGWWYLFASFDFCCRGARSTYNIRVGRSETVTGPYIDKAGVPMLEGGGTMVIEATTPNWRGPGHEAVLQDTTGDYLVFHAYQGQTGRPELKISTMLWQEGWPRVAALP
jgi:beta-glucosidase